MKVVGFINIEEKINEIANAQKALLFQRKLNHFASFLNKYGANYKKCGHTIIYEGFYTWHSIDMNKNVFEIEREIYNNLQN